MNKRLKTILKITTTIVVVCCIGFGVIYLKLTIPSERELWRITDNNLEDPMIVNNLLLFKGRTGDNNSWCEYVYVVDKNTGKAIWSSENYTTDQYCNHSWGSVRTSVISISVTGNMIFVSSSYWGTDDKQEYVLCALNSSNGDLLWKVDGYAGYPYAYYALLDYTNTDTKNIYLASKGGSFSAIDTSTGKQVWKQKIPRVDYSEDILIEYHDQVVYYYYSGNNTLTAFDASNGNQIWSVSEPHYANDIIFSSNVIYLKTSSSKSSTSFITALDSKTGNLTWELAFESISTPEIIGNEIYIPVSYGNTLGKFVVVNKSTGKLVWQFNEDYSHGDIRHFIKDKVIYIGTKDGFMFALDSKTGEIIWQTKSSGFPYYFHMEGDTLVVGYEEKYVSAFDIKSGIQKWIFDVGMEKYWHPLEFIITSDGVVYVASPTHSKIYALEIETGKELWSWNHNHPRDKAYFLKALDGNVIYVDQYRRFLGQDWFFALKTEP